MSKISIIIPALNEEKYIKNCLESILKSDYLKEDIEIFVVDGMSSDTTRDIVKSYEEKDNTIKLLDNPKKITPISMNIGIEALKGEYVFIISAHASYPVDYFSKLVESIKELDADCVGAVLITEVKSKTKKAHSIREILSHRFGVGAASFRTGVSKVAQVDTVAFGCYKRETFNKYGLFNEKLIRNQDIELNKRIINGGGKIYLIPDVTCTYYARENFKDLAKNQYQNGYWNILTAYYTKTLNSLSLRHFIPLFFVLSLLLPLLFAPITLKAIWLSFFSLGSYLVLVIIISLKLKNSHNSFFYLIGSFLTLHFSYGIGSLVGIFSVVKKYLKGDR